MTGVAPSAPVAGVPNATTNQPQGGTVGAATPGTVPQSATLAATVVNPPAALARLAAGTLLDGQVLARDAALGQVLVKTLYGQLLVTLNNPPAEGSRLALQLQAPGADNSRAALVTVDPPTPGPARGAPQGTSGNLSNPPPSLARLPAGTAIEGRILPTDQRGQIPIQTGHGTVILRSAAPLPAGARVAVQILPNPSGVAGVLPVKVSVIALPQAAAGAAEEQAATVVLSPGAQAGATSGASAAPAATARATIVAQPPAGALEPGALVEGRVVGPDGRGAVIVETAQGPLALRSAVPLPAGSGVVLQVPPDGGEQVAIVSVDGRPPVRLVPGAVIQGRVVGPDGQGATLIETAQGPVAVRSPVPLPPGAAVVLQVPPEGGEQLAVVSVNGRAVLSAPLPTTPQAALPTPAALVNPAEPTLALAREWPALSDSVAALKQTDPNGVAARTLDTAIPRPGLQLAPTLALVLGALRDGDLKRWIGDAPADALAKAGRPDLLARVGDEFAKLARLAEAPQSQQDWRTYLVPFNDGQQVQQIQLFTRRHQQNSKDGETDDITARFVFDVELTRLGRIQLDGLAGEQRFDLMVRSRTPLSAEMRTHITLLFGAAREEGGFQGEVGFQTVSEFPVAPLDDKAEPTPHGIVV
jgi:hypothetical protein